MSTKTANKKSTKKSTTKSSTGTDSVVNVIAKEAGCKPRRVRQVARKLGLGTGKGQRYRLSAPQRKRLVKALKS